jgi:fatty acid desaturase
MRNAIKIVASVPIRATQKKLKTSFATGGFIVGLVVLISLAIAYVNELLTEPTFLGFFILLIIIIVLGYAVAYRKNMLWKKVKI